MNKLTLIPGESFTEQLETLLYTIFSKNKKEKVCFISLNKSCAYLNNEIIKPKFSRNILIIDGATKSFSADKDSIKDTGKCKFISVTQLMKELAKIQKEHLSKGKYRKIIVDSLSTLLIYYSEQEVLDFLLKLSDDMAVQFCDIHFFCTRVAYPRISKFFISYDISTQQITKDEFTLTFPVERLTSLLEELKQKIEDGDKENATSLYERAIKEYGSLKKNQVSKEAKKEIYRKCAGYCEQIRKMA